MDELKRGLDDEGVEPPPPADRDYWDKRGSKLTIQLADELFGIAHSGYLLSGKNLSAANRHFWSSRLT
jgi:hypothetical protein